MEHPGTAPGAGVCVENPFVGTPFASSTVEARFLSGEFTDISGALMGPACLTAMGEGTGTLVEVSSPLGALERAFAAAAAGECSWKTAVAVAAREERT